jgi:hypothetical protein
MSIMNDITKSVEGADNLSIKVLVAGIEDTPEPITMTWRQARARFAKPLCELYDACLRWAMDLENYSFKVTKLEFTANLELVDRLRMRVCAIDSDGLSHSCSGNCMLEEDTLPHRGGATYLFLSGTLQELEDIYEDAVYRRQIKEKQS